jgi:hypothetical protein
METKEKTQPSLIAVATASSSATLITLKSINQIDWNWSWVLSPIWVPICFILIYGVLNGVVLGYQQTNNRE